MGKVLKYNLEESGLIWEIWNIQVKYGC
jgi:hypothetical protein